MPSIHSPQGGQWIQPTTTTTTKSKPKAQKQKKGRGIHAAPTEQSQVPRQTTKEIINLSREILSDKNSDISKVKDFAKQLSNHKIVRLIETDTFGWRIYKCICKIFTFFTGKLPEYEKELLALHEIQIETDDRIKEMSEASESHPAVLTLDVAFKMVGVPYFEDENRALSELKKSTIPIGTEVFLKDERGVYWVCKKTNEKGSIVSETIQPGELWLRIQEKSNEKGLGLQIPEPKQEEQPILPKQSPSSVTEQLPETQSEQPERSDPLGRTRLMGNFLKGLRTEGTLQESVLTADNRLKIGDKVYTPLTGNVRDFSTNGCLISAGNKAEREIVSLDPDSTYFKAKVAEFDQFIQQKKSANNGPLSEPELLICVNEFMHQNIFTQPPSEEAVLEIGRQWTGTKMVHLGAEGRSEAEVPIIPIEKFMAEGIGVCRHHAMVASWFIDHLVKKGELQGVVCHVRSDVVNFPRQGGKGGVVGHVWVEFIGRESRNKWLIDTTEDRIVEFSNPFQVKNIVPKSKPDEDTDLYMIYGRKAVEKMSKVLPTAVQQSKMPQPSGVKEQQNVEQAFKSPEITSYRSKEEAIEQLKRKSEGMGIVKIDDAQYYVIEKFPNIANPLVSRQTPEKLLAYIGTKPGAKQMPPASSPLEKTVVASQGPGLVTQETVEASSGLITQPVQEKQKAEQPSSSGLNSGQKMDSLQESLKSVGMLYCQNKADAERALRGEKVLVGTIAIVKLDEDKYYSLIKLGKNSFQPVAMSSDSLQKLIHDKTKKKAETMQMHPADPALAKTVVAPKPVTEKPQIQRRLRYRIKQPTITEPAISPTQPLEQQILKQDLELAGILYCAKPSEANDLLKKSGTAPGTRVIVPGEKNTYWLYTKGEGGTNKVIKKSSKQVLEMIRQKNI